MASREAQVHLQVGLADAFRRSEEALMVIGGIVAARDQAAWRLEGTVPMSFKSFGERVQIELSGVDGDVSVRVKSTTKVPTALLDWGKNADNVKRIIGWFTR